MYNHTWLIKPDLSHFYIVHSRGDSVYFVLSSLWQKNISKQAFVNRADYKICPQQSV